MEAVAHPNRCSKMTNLLCEPTKDSCHTATVYVSNSSDLDLFLKNRFDEGNATAAQALNLN